MDSSSAAILGAFIGGTAIVGSYVILESYKRHRDRQGTASAFAGEIAAELRMGEARKYVENFTTIAAQLEQGDERPFPAIVSGEHRGPEPALRPLRDRIGMLPGDLPERVAQFHLYLGAIRTDLLRLAEGEFRGRPADAAILIREDLHLWVNDTVPLGRQLVTDLRALVRRRWFGLF